MHIYRNLTSVQKQFVQYAAIGLLTVGIVGFFVHGLSTVSFGGNKSAAFEKKQFERREAALVTALRTEEQRAAQYRATTFEGTTVFQDVAAEQDIYIAELKKIAARDGYDTGSVSTFDTSVLTSDVSSACAAAIDLEQSALDTYARAKEDLGINIDMQSVLQTLTANITTSYLPQFTACADATE